MSRVFKKISFEQFKKDIKDDKDLYDNYVLPRRSTKASAGYDFFLIEDITIKPGEIKKVPTGYKAEYKPDEALLIIVRSSLGFKYNIRMTNQVGLIDSDYYNNIKNEGHMYVSLQNHSDEEITLNKGDAYVQGVFIKYLKTDDDIEVEKRTGWSVINGG